jgi:transposase
MIRNDLKRTITHALDEMKIEQGEAFSFDKVNLAELERRTGISRAKLRRLKDQGFKFKEHGRKGLKAKKTVLSGYEDTIDKFLTNGVSNSNVIFERIKEEGYTGGLTTVKDYIASHKHLLPPKRQIVSSQGNRGRRYKTAPGEAYQMDWGFVHVENGSGGDYRAACFAMVCHHCGERYIEFFPNAKQENLFIGMLHGFEYMGVPEYILTDNMKSVVIGRDEDRHPIWQKDYEVFMDTVGFKTKLCKPRHPFTKGKVERLVRYVKTNFLAYRAFGNITDLNFEALKWCDKRNSEYSRTIDDAPGTLHRSKCLNKASVLRHNDFTIAYLCPKRKITFDGFVNYEGRRFGVPYWYPRKECRVRRDGYKLTIYSDDMEQVLAEHDVTWSRKDSFCDDQYSLEQPEELPTAPVKEKIYQIKMPATRTGFEKFNFAEGLEDE